MKPKEEFIFSILIIKCLEGSISEHELEVLNGILNSDPVASKMFAEQIFINSRIARPGNIGARAVMGPQLDSQLSDVSEMKDVGSQNSMDSNVSVRGVDIRGILNDEIQEALESYDVPGIDDMMDEWVELLDYEKTAPALVIPKEQPARELIQKVVYPPRKKRKLSRYHKFQFAAFAAMLMFIAVIGFLPKNKPELPVVASLVDSIGAVWDKGMQQPEFDGYLRQSSYYLKEGYASIRFDSGAEVTVEAPVEMNLIAGDNMELVSGRIYAVVPEEAIGFTVTAASNKVVDLGTEFGVEVQTNKSAEVHIAKGEVLLLSGSESSKKTQSRILAGQAKKVYSDGFAKDIPVDNQKFVHMIDSGSGVVWNGVSNIGDSGDGVVFSESFESPVAHGYSLGSVPQTGWIGTEKEKGYGAECRGLLNQGDLSVFSTPYGRQGYLLDYTNSGLTTSETGISEVLAEGMIYSVTFNAAYTKQVQPPQLEGDEIKREKFWDRDESEYLVELVAFEPGEERTDIRGLPGSRAGTVLAAVNGVVKSNDMTAGDCIMYKAKADDPNLGKNIAIRLVKAGGSVIYDNIKLRVWESKNSSFSAE